MGRKRIWKNDTEKVKACNYRKDRIPFTIVDGMVVKDGQETISYNKKSITKNKVKRNNNNFTMKSNGNDINIKINGPPQKSFTYQKFEKWISSKAIKKKNNIMAIGNIHLRQSDTKNIYLLIELLKEEGMI